MSDPDVPLPPPPDAPPPPPPEAPPRTRRHPFRGLGGGVLLGIGVTLLLISYSILPFGVATPWIVLALFPVIGVLLGLFAPARTPRTRG